MEWHIVAQHQPFCWSEPSNPHQRKDGRVAELAQLMTAFERVAAGKVVQLLARFAEAAGKAPAPIRPRHSIPAASDTLHQVRKLWFNIAPE